MAVIKQPAGDDFPGLEFAKIPGSRVGFFKQGLERSGRHRPVLETN